MRGHVLVLAVVCLSLSSTAEGRRSRCKIVFPLAPNLSWTLVKGNCKAGRGVARSEKATYYGMFKNGRFHGEGTLTAPSGIKIFTGQFKDGWFHGKGTMTYSLKSKYVGEFKKGKKHGRGTMDKAFTNSNTFRYVGEWLEDSEHGKGEIIYPTGERFVGIFVNGRPSGPGKFIYPDGKTYAAEFSGSSYYSGGLPKIDKPVADKTRTVRRGCLSHSECKGGRMCAGGRCETVRKGSLVERAIKTGPRFMWMGDYSSDVISGLSWYTKNKKMMDWEEARMFCEKLVTPHGSVWRLPIIEELRAIIYDCPNTELGGRCPAKHRRDKKRFSEADRIACDTACSGTKQKAARWRVPEPLQLAKGTYWSLSDGAEGDDAMAWVLMIDGTVIAAIKDSKHTPDKKPRVHVACVMNETWKRRRGE